MQWPAMVLLVACTPTVADVLVWKDAPSSVSPYATWESAATNLQEAVDYAVANAIPRVLVTNGTYYQSAPSNQERGGGGIYMRNTPSVENCTIVRNQADEAGGGIFSLGGTVVNAIVSDNTAPVGANLYTLTGVTYTCSPDASADWTSVRRSSAARL